MKHCNVKSLPHDGISAIAIARDTLESINESTYQGNGDPLVCELEGEFVQALELSVGPVIIDIQETRTQFMNHANVAVLSRLIRLLRIHKRRGCICCSVGVKEILDFCGMKKISSTAANLDGAIEVLANGPANNV